MKFALHVTLILAFGFALLAAAPEEQSPKPQYDAENQLMRPGFELRPLREAPSSLQRTTSQGKLKCMKFRNQVSSMVEERARIETTSCLAARSRDRIKSPRRKPADAPRRAPVEYAVASECVQRNCWVEMTDKQEIDHFDRI